MRIEASWVALSVVVLAVGVLLVASLDDSLFIKQQQPVDPAPAVARGSGARPEHSALSLATATPSSTQTAPTVGMPPASAIPVPAPPEQPKHPPAPSAAEPSVPAAAAAPTPTVAAQSPRIAQAPPPDQPAPLPPAPTAAAEVSATPAPTAAIAPVPPPSVLPAETEMSEADRRQVQEALHRLDYYKGPLDGIFGPLTRAAIRRFQRQNMGSVATGHLTADQANRLVMPR